MNQKVRHERLPRVSILMPVRNEEAYIERSLGSVLAQDYPEDLVEVIIADGMSSDRTRSIIAEMQADHPNVRVIDNPNRTVPFGLNLATEMSRGEVILRVDGHCEIAPDYVRNCVRHLLQDQVDGVGGPWEQVGETPTAKSISIATACRFGVGGSAYRVHRGEDRLVDTVPFPAYTRAIVAKVGPYDEELTRDQDDEYNYRIRESGGKLLLAGDVRTLYYSRGTLARMASQYFQYGFWKVRVAQKHPRQMRSRHFVPAAFVSSLIGLALLSPLSRNARRTLAGMVATYVIADLIVSASLARREGWHHFGVLAKAFPLLHLSYGAGFLLGLVRFANRWKGMQT